MGLKQTKTIQFNTGRPYTAEGQRIIVRVSGHEEVQFCDLDRCISGTIKQFPLHRHTSDSALAAAVMQRYDAMQYDDVSTYDWSPSWYADLPETRYHDYR